VASIRGLIEQFMSLQLVFGVKITITSTGRFKSFKPENRLFMSFALAVKQTMHEER
jgi:hypothetical protein